MVAKRYPLYKAGAYICKTYAEAKQLALVLQETQGRKVHVMEKLDPWTAWHEL